jgi:hypothetical protein
MGGSEVKLKRKVQLRTKVEGPESPSVTNPIEPEKSSGNGKNFLIIAAVVVVCIIGWLLLSKSENEQITEPEVAEVAVPSSEEQDESNAASEESEQPQAEETAPKEEEATQETAAPKETPVEKPTTNVVSSAANVSGDVEAEAMKVIRGDYGDGEERKAKLGSEYQKIQNRVNQLKREGVF